MQCKWEWHGTVLDGIFKRLHEVYMFLSHYSGDDESTCWDETSIIWVSDYGGLRPPASPLVITWMRNKCLLSHWNLGVVIAIKEKAMASHSSTLAWKIPWTEEPGGLQSMGSQRVGHDWVTSLSLFTFLHWRKKWQPTLVFLPGESQGRGSLVGCRLWGRTESDTTEVT